MHIQKIQSKIYVKKKYLIHFWITCASIFSLYSESELQLTWYGEFQSSLYFYSSWYPF